VKEIACAHVDCRCTLSSTSPDPYCCEFCAQRAAEKGRCACGHDACGGMPGVDVEKPARIEPEMDPSLGRKA